MNCADGGGGFFIAIAIGSLPRFASWAPTYVFVCFGWIFFRSPNFKTAAMILRKLVLIDRTGIGYLYLPL